MRLDYDDFVQELLFVLLIFSRFDVSTNVFIYFLKDNKSGNLRSNIVKCGIEFQRQLKRRCSRECYPIR